ncbi:MAG: 2,3-bisphosphoglycerate-independent phosphoglycerate mutase [Pseudonocardiaceae bacterium]
MSATRGTLLILDGWGESAPGPGNAIAAATTPALDTLLTRYSSVRLAASGTAVGLPEGVVGNSEIGHLVMGAGRPLAYDSLLVQRAADSGGLRGHPLLREVGEELAAAGRALHLVALCSRGRIHSDSAHLGELLRAAGAAGLRDVRIHAITDGRDVANGTAGQCLADVTAMAAAAGVGRCVSVIGRNYAMDKSGQTGLVERACRLIVDGHGDHAAKDLAAAVAAGPAQDGWWPATRIAGDDGPGAGVRAGDAVLFANFRSDRTAPLADMVVDRLAGTGREVRVLSLARYDTRARIPALVARADASGGLADTLDGAGVRTVRIAEREKFEHVTFFSNGRDARPRPLEEQVCVPTLAGDDYAAGPRMNVAEVVRQVIAAGRRADVGLVIANLANIDVVGHTGHYEATVRATEAVDRAVAEICAAAGENGRWVLLVGDHGNGEQMLQAAPDGGVRPYGGHTCNLVPCVLMAAHGQGLLAPAGVLPALPSVGPTVLSLLGVEPPPAMSPSALLRSRVTRRPNTSRSTTISR